MLVKVILDIPKILRLVNLKLPNPELFLIHSSRGTGGESHPGMLDEAHHGLSKPAIATHFPTLKLSTAEKIYIKRR